jgi:hypothetical protein
VEGSGYIKLHRKFLDWEWYDDMNCKIVFIHLLLKANYKDKQWRGKTIMRGQLFTSIDNLSSELHLTTKQIRITISKLENTGEIIKNGASDGTYITICNYDNYQQSEQADGQTEGEPRASEGQAEGKRGATTKKDKKENKEKKVRMFVPPTLDEVKKYFTDNGYYESAAVKAYNYYAAGNWIDSKGTPVTAWKQKMIGVWFKPENKMESIGIMP